MSTYIVHKTSGLWNTKAYHCQIVHYIYIHSSQDEWVVSKQQSLSLPDRCTISTYIIRKTSVWSLKLQSLSLPDSVLSTNIFHKTREWSLKTQSLSLTDSVLMSTYIVHKTGEGVVSETPKSIIVPIVYYVYIHSSQDGGGSGLWNTKVYHCPIVYYVYIHSSQDEGVISETQSVSLPDSVTMSTYIVHKTSGLWNTKAYHCQIVHYIYIHSSQDEWVVL